MGAPCGNKRLTLAFTCHREMTSARSRSFNVYGYCFSIRSSAEEPLCGIEEDFRFFSTEGPTDGVVVELFPEAPPLDAVPANDAMAYTPRNVVYREGGKRFIDYHGRALGIQDEATGDFRLYSQDTGLLYEAAYLYLLSQIGQRLDAAGLHRIHALGVVVKRRAVLVMLPMGGGKSTLGLHVLQHPPGTDPVRRCAVRGSARAATGVAPATRLVAGIGECRPRGAPADDSVYGVQAQAPRELQLLFRPGLRVRRARSFVRRGADHGPVLPDRIDQSHGRGAKLHGELCNRHGLFQGLEFLPQSSVWDY